MFLNVCKQKVFWCEIFNILFSYQEEYNGRFSNLHCCTFKFKSWNHNTEIKQTEAYLQTYYIQHPNPYLTAVKIYCNRFLSHMAWFLDPLLIKTQPTTWSKLWWRTNFFTDALARVLKSCKRPRRLSYI